MSTGEIAKLALTRGLVRCTGKTPEATMASALYTDIKRREDRSLFVRPREGLFGLREWVKDGIIKAPSGGVQYPLVHHMHAHAQAHNAVPIHVETSEDRAGNTNTSQDTGDRLMELLCAAEKINRAAAATSSQEADGDIAIHGVASDHEEGTSAALRCGEGGHAEAVKAAEAEISRLEVERGLNHPEVGKGYLTLVKMYMAECGMPSEMRYAAEVALGRVEKVMAACQEALMVTTGEDGSSPSTDGVPIDVTVTVIDTDAAETLAAVFKSTGVDVPVVVKNEHNAVHGPSVAPTPVPLEESRQWPNPAGMINGATHIVSSIHPTQFVRKAGVCPVVVGGGYGISGLPNAAVNANILDDAENDAEDVEICLPVPKNLIRMQMGGQLAVPAS